MSHMTATTVKKTFESYCQAIDALEKRGFTELNRVGSGYSFFIGDEFRARYKQDAYKEADVCFIQTEHLFDMHGPKQIQKSFWTYRDSFFRIIFKAEQDYKSYYMGLNSVDEIEGFDTNHYVEKSYDKSIEIEFGGFGVGIGNWEEGKKKLRKIAKQCKPDVRDKILEELEEADEHLKKWRKERKEMLTEEL